MDIVCTGSIAYDYLMTFPGYFRDHILVEKLESISLSFLVDSMVRQRGGVAANIAYTLALLGGHPRLVGTAGEDFGEYRARLENEGVDTSGVRIILGKFTASFFANTDLSNAQISSFYTGAMANASEISLEKLPGGKPGIVLISPNDPGAMVKYVNECQREGIPYLYDPSQQIIRMEPQDLQNGIEGAEALFVNEYEFELLQKRTGMDAETILSHPKFTVITCGENGAKIVDHGEITSVPVVSPAVVADPTGVGDAFRGGFLTGYRMGWDWSTCGKMGALAATYCLEQRGTQNHHYTPTEFVTRFRQNFDDHGLLDALNKTEGR